MRFSSWWMMSIFRLPNFYMKIPITIQYIYRPFLWRVKGPAPIAIHFPHGRPIQFQLTNCLLSTSYILGCRQKNRTIVKCESSSSLILKLLCGKEECWGLAWKYISFHRYQFRQSLKGQLAYLWPSILGKFDAEFLRPCLVEV